jgi:hypothetical protein
MKLMKPDILNIWGLSIVVNRRTGSTEASPRWYVAHGCIAQGKTAQPHREISLQVSIELLLRAF